ncbi:MAG: glycosyltransferase family 2 protein [Patescibacteria group bacterium]
MSKISVVINTFNEAINLPRAIASIKSLADEIVVCDMQSTDNTVEIAKKLGAKVYTHKYMSYVEPSRNFAISKANGDWIFVLDADEELPNSLISRLKKFVKNPTADYYRISRKNIIFGKWIKHSRWWPDYNIRLFRKGFVSWDEEIHSVPKTTGKGMDLPDKENFAIIHHNYSSIGDYLERMLRYSDIQSKDLMKNGYVFSWNDLIRKPLGEFLSRFFVGEGYKDKIHGLVLSSLQAFSEFVLYLRIWEKQGFKDENISNNDFSKEFERVIKEFKWWLRKKFSFFFKFF